MISDLDVLWKSNRNHIRPSSISFETEGLNYLNEGPEKSYSNFSTKDQKIKKLKNENAAANKTIIELENELLACKSRIDKLEIELKNQHQKSELVNQSLSRTASETFIQYH